MFIKFLKRMLPVFLVIFSMAHVVFAETKSFVKEYTYQAGDSDSKLTCRAIALEQVKRLLLEEFGTYLESQTEVRNFQLTKDQIVTYTSGVVMSVIINEKWDGQTYFMKAKISADPDEVTKSIDALRKDRDKTNELVELQARTNAAMDEITQLKAELAATKNDKAKKDRYAKSVNKLLANEMVEKGLNFRKQDKFQEAIEAFTKAIGYLPENARAYSQRGWVYHKLKQYDKANSDYDMAIKINPSYLYTYENKAFTLFAQNKLEEALALIEFSLVSDPKFSRGYNARGYFHALKGSMASAKADYGRAIELDPQYFAPYINRGYYYFKDKQFDNSLQDYNKGLELNPYFAKGYFLRGNVYKKLKDKIKAEADYQMAQKLGYDNSR